MSSLDVESTGSEFSSLPMNDEQLQTGPQELTFNDLLNLAEAYEKTQIAEAMAKMDLPRRSNVMSLENILLPPASPAQSFSSFDVSPDDDPATNNRLGHITSNGELSGGQIRTALSDIVSSLISTSLFREADPFDPDGDLNAISFLDAYQPELSCFPSSFMDFDGPLPDLVYPQEDQLLAEPSPNVSLSGWIPPTGEDWQELEPEELELQYPVANHPPSSYPAWLYSLPEAQEVIPSTPHGLKPEPLYMDPTGGPTERSPVSYTLDMPFKELESTSHPPEPATRATLAPTQPVAHRFVTGKKSVSQRSSTSYQRVGPPRGGVPPSVARDVTIAASLAVEEERARARADDDARRKLTPVPSVMLSVGGESFRAGRSALATRLVKLREGKTTVRKAPVEGVAGVKRRGEDENDPVPRKRTRV